MCVCEALLFKKKSRVCGVRMYVCVCVCIFLKKKIVDERVGECVEREGGMRRRKEGVSQQRSLV